MSTEPVTHVADENLGDVMVVGGGISGLAAALALGDYTLAAHEMKDSRWFTQVGRRAQKLHKIMLEGELPQ